MARKTLADLLDDITHCEAALNAARAGQAYAYDGRSYTRQDIPSLHAELTRLQRQYERQAAREAGVRTPEFKTAVWL